MAASKPLLIPWLISQIDSGRYPGLSWTNEERTEFCVPWKHGLRQDSCDVDVLIFKAWAEISGIYVEGRTQADPSVWKRNFRSALRAKGCILIRDCKNDAANPHKVFQLPGGEQPRRSQEPVVSPCQDLSQPSLPLIFENLYLAEDTITQGQVLCPEQQLLGAVGPSPTATPDLLQQCLEESYIHQPQQDIPRSEILPREEQRVEDFKEKMSTTMVDNNLCTQFKVIAYYRGTKVLEQTVENSAGFKVVFSRENMECLSPFTRPDLSWVYLPSPEDVAIHDQTQANLTRRILEKLGNGLEVTVSGATIYGLRRGDSKIYWSLCKFEKRETPREVQKQEPDSLYSMKDFIRGLLEFIGNGHESPPFSLFFCLGEKWPDPEQRPWEKKLIMLEVIITSFELLKMIAVDGGASSLQSVELQISGTHSLMDTLEEMMEYYDGL